MIVVGFACRPWRRNSLARQLYCSRQHDCQLVAERGVIRESETPSRACEGSAVGLERTEYDTRQAAARELAREHGFFALIAWSRGVPPKIITPTSTTSPASTPTNRSSPMSLGAGARTATLRWCSPWTGRAHC
jgi:hypothetical protein